MNRKFNAKTLIMVGGVFAVIVLPLGVLRIVFSGNSTPAAAGVNPDVVASQAFQQGAEQGREAGLEEGQRAAIMPAIGDAQNNAAIALSEADQSAQALLDTLICSRKSAWVDFANDKAAEGLNPIAVLEEHLRTVAVEQFKELTATHGTLNASGPLFGELSNPVIENAAIVAAIGEMRHGGGGRCAVDLTAAHTANTSYLFESQRATAQRREIMQIIDDQLTTEGVAQNDTAESE